MFRRRPEPLPAAPGQESVWDFPRPARAEAFGGHLEVIFDGRVLAETRGGMRTLETSHPPTYYFPPNDVDMSRLRLDPGRRSLCEWKGQANYFDVLSGGRVAAGAAWCYRWPTGAFSALAGFLAFYPAAMDVCRVDGEVATPQPGGFYGGWVTSAVVGPFKGEPGTMGW